MIQIEQGSELWLELRKTKITATDATTIMGVSPWTTPLELWEQKLDIREPTPINGAMKRGMLLEPKARGLFEKKTGILMVPEVRIKNFMMASLDGISMDGKEIVEIKCTSKKNHDLAKANKIPPYYYPQVQHQIECVGVDRCHYCSFDGNDIVVVVVYRDNNYIESMLEKELEFYNCLKTFTEPKAA
jgi:putative phage-type endonuclease